MIRPLHTWTVLLLVAASSSAAPAQPPEALARAVDDYLVEADPTVAAAKLERILGAGPAPERLLAAVRRRPPAFGRRFEMVVPHGGRPLRCRVDVPAGHGPESAPLPVSLNVTLGRIPDAIAVPGAINVSVPGYDPPRLSDAGRDGFIKILRSVAWRANGDPERLWMTGFSWAGHATFDVAMHRPGILRGFVAMGGAPQRRQFRLLPNLGGCRILALCGTGDDAELLWNLRELGRRAKPTGFHYELFLDPEVPGRLYPSPRGVTRVGPFVHESPERPAAADRGELLVDGPRVENGWIRIDAVDPERVRLPERVPVASRLGHDARRRATLRALERTAARLSWTRREGEGVSLSFRSRGVREGTLFLRASLADRGTAIRLLGLRGGTQSVALDVDARTLLEETRRRGDRLDPVLTRIAVRFDE